MCQIYYTITGTFRNAGSNTFFHVVINYQISHNSNLIKLDIELKTTTSLHTLACPSLYRVLSGVSTLLYTVQGNKYNMEYFVLD